MADKGIKYAKALMNLSPSEGGLSYGDYPNPYQNPNLEGGGLRTWRDKQGNYQGEMIPKYTGWMGTIPAMEKGRVMTEYSAGGENGQMFYPTIFQGMNPDQVEVARMLEAGKMNWKNPRAAQLDRAARAAAQERINMGLSPFKNPGDE